MTMFGKARAMTAGAFLKRMFIVNLVLAVCAAVICLVVSGTAMALAAGVAGVVGALNLFLLGLLVLRMLTPGARKVAAILLLVAKMAILAAAVVVILAVMDMDPIGLAAGFSSTVAAVLVVSAFVGLSGSEIQL